MLSKNVNNKICAPKFIFFNEKKSERFQWFLSRKLTLENQILALNKFAKFNDFIWLQLIFCQKPF